MSRGVAVVTGGSSGIADCVARMATRPPHLNVDRLVVQPRNKASARRATRC